MAGLNCVVDTVMVDPSPRTPQTNARTASVVLIFIAQYILSGRGGVGWRWWDGVASAVSPRQFPNLDQRSGVQRRVLVQNPAGTTPLVDPPFAGRTAHSLISISFFFLSPQADAGQLCSIPVKTRARITRSLFPPHTHTPLGGRQQVPIRVKVVQRRFCRQSGNSIAKKKGGNRTRE